MNQCFQTDHAVKTQILLTCLYRNNCCCFFT